MPLTKEAQMDRPPQASFVEVLGIPEDSKDDQGQNAWDPAYLLSCSNVFTSSRTQRCLVVGSGH